MIKTIQTHPKGLWFLCAVEIWERFSYYGMRAILILYLTSEFWGMNDTQAYLTYGSYVAFIFMAPLIGGYISDTFLGHSTSVKYGCIFIMIGHILLSMTQASFFLGLGFVVVGTGFFKPSMATNIGELYGKEKQHLKDSGYTLFYMSVNLGSAISVIIVPIIAEYYSWHLGFGAAAIGIATGLIILLMGQAKGIIPRDKIKASKRVHTYTFISAILAAFIFAYLISNTNNTANVLYLSACSALIYLTYKAIKGGKEYIIPILAVIKISIIVMVFWALFEQTATSVLLFTKRFVDLNIFGFKISAANVSVANNIFVITLSPLFAILWNKYNTSIFKKMGSGLILTGLGMAAFTLAAYAALNGSLASLLIIILGYMFITMGELSCSPTGLAAISKVAPTDIAALLFGIWGIKSSVSNYLASYIATFTDIKDSGNSLIHKQAEAYYNLFFNLTIAAIVIGVIVLLVSNLFKKIYKI